LPPATPAPAIQREVVLAALTHFTGTYPQLPPPFSAKKVGGTPAYLLARLQKDVELKAAQVSVRALDLLTYEEGLATLRIVSSSGFYVRALAHELGQRLGCGAHLESLRRTRAGDFHEAAATPLAVVQAEGVHALRRLVPLASLLSKLPQVIVNQRGARRAAHGNALAGEDFDDGDAVQPDPGGETAGPVRVVDADGALLAIGQPGRGGLLQPIVVLI